MSITVGADNNGSTSSRTQDDAPYVQARMVDVGSLERSERNSSSWRRMAFGLSALVLISLVCNVVQATKDHTEALVYGQDTIGHMTLLGYAGHTRTPTDLAIEAALGQFITAVRDIPGNDDALVDRNALFVLAMLARDTPADANYRDFISHNNPKLLGKKNISRTVLNPQVSKITDLTWQLQWTEHLENRGIVSDRPYSGTVTLAAPAQAPLDPTIGRTNPTGIFIRDYDLKWPPL